jgi:hypothetical protein
MWNTILLNNFRFEKYRIFLAFACMLLVATPVVAEKKINKKDCTFNHKKLYGRIQIVKYFPDVKVQVVKYFPDIKVKNVDAFAYRCGEWEIVNHFPDTKVQFVNHFPDVKIEYVSCFPGF